MHAHLLFVEETEGSLRPLRAALERTGLTASVVRGSTDLDHLLRSVCPDLVVVEAAVPPEPVDAHPTAVQICRRTYPWLPVVVQLNSITGGPERLSGALGADLVLEAPDPDEETTRRIRELLGGRRPGFAR